MFFSKFIEWIIFISKMNSLLLICTFQALFLALLIFFKKKRVLSDMILATWLLVIALHIFLEFLQLYNFQHDFPYPWLIGLDVSFTVLHAALIYVYILSYSRMAGKWWNYRLHLLPFLLVNILLFVFYYSRSPEDKIRDFTSVMNGDGFYIEPIKYLTYLIMLLVIIYLIAGLILIQKHKRNIRNQFSTIQGLELKWLQVLLYSLGGILVVAILLEILSNTFFLLSPAVSSVIVFIIIAIGIFYIGIHGILSTDAFTNYNHNLTNRDSFTTKTKRTISNSVTAVEEYDEMMEEKFSQLMTYIREKKPFLETSLTLQSLSEMLDMKAHFLSKLINQKAGCNFFDFVNNFRIEEFKEQVLDPANHNYTLLSIAYSCGFNSKTAFNRAFKNSTGTTPSEYFHDALNK